MTTSLEFAVGLSLPIPAVTEKLAFLGTTGSGKTYAATKLAEQMWKAGAQFVALDPVGKWWGLRLAKDGEKPGIPIPVFGGLNGDLPLEVSGGALVADLIVDRGISAVIDVSQFESDADKARFARDFAARLYFRRKSLPAATHLFLEECQEFVPQNPQKGEERMLHAFVVMQKLGRNFGIGSSYISQRPQEVNKKALNMAQTLFAFRMTGPQERDAIKRWAQEKGVDQDLVATLPKLKTGTCHVWSPTFLEITDKVVEVKPKRTFDASATPEVGVQAAQRDLAQIDVEAIKKDMAATIQKAEAEDPKVLQRRIAQLEKELKKMSGATPAEVQKVVEKKIVDQGAIDRAVKGALRDVLKEVSAKQKPVLKAVATATTGLQRIATLLGDGNTQLQAVIDALSKIPSAEDLMPALPDPATRTLDGERISSMPAEPRAVVPFPERPARVVRPPSSRPPRESNGNLTPSAQKILDSAARLRSLGVDAPSRSHVAVLGGISPTSSATERAFAQLIGEGLLEIPDAGAVRLTAAGERAAAVPDRAPTMDEYHDQWRRMMSAGSELKLFDAMIDSNLESISRTELAEKALISPTSSATERAFAWLIAMDLFRVAGKGQVGAGALLFPEGLD